MLRDNKIILKNSVILFIRLIFTSVIGLFTSRFVIQGLGASDFGLYSIVGGLVVVMAFLNTVMSSTTYRYIAFEMGRGCHEEINKVFNISLVINLCLAFSVFLFTETVGVYYVNNYLNVGSSKLPDALFVLRLSSYTTIISIVSVPYQGLITAKENFLVQGLIEIVRSLLTFTVAITIFYCAPEYRLRTYTLFITIVSIVPTALFAIYCKRNYSEYVRWNFQRSKNKYKEMINYTGWLMFGTAAWVGQRQGSDLIVNSFFGTMLNAAMGISNQVNNIVLLFARNLGQAAVPQITKSVGGDNPERTKTLVAYISKYTCFLMFLPALPILLETDHILRLWLGELPPYTVYFCQLLITSSLIESSSSGVPAVIMATGKVKIFMMMCSGISLMSLPVAYILFLAGYPPYTILILNASTTGINLVVNQVLLKRLTNFDVKYFFKEVYMKIFLVLLFVAPLFWIRDFFHSGFPRLLLFSLFAALWLLVVIFFVGIDTKERERFLQLFNLVK